MLTSNTPNTRTYARIVNRMGWALTLFFAIFLTLNVITLTFFDDVTLGGGSKGEILAYSLINAIGYMAPFFIAGVIFYGFCKREETMRPRLELHLPKVFPLLILAGLCINTAAAYLNSIFCTFIGYTIPEELLGGRYDSPGAIIMYMGVSLAPAFAEEFLFRGVVYGNLRPYGRTQALLLSSLAFAFMHQNIGQLFYTFVCGIVLALMYEYTGSIWCSIFFHLFNNELSVLTEVLYYSVLGDGGMPFLQLWDILIFGLGLAAICFLFLYDRRRRAASGQKTGRYFGTPTRVPEVSDHLLPTGIALRMALTPGSITFGIFAILEMVSMYFIVLSYNV